MTVFNISLQVTNIGLREGPCDFLVRSKGRSFTNGPQTPCALLKEKWLCGAWCWQPLVLPEDPGALTQMLCQREAASGKEQSFNPPPPAWCAQISCAHLAVKEQCWGLAKDRGPAQSPVWALGYAAIISSADATKRWTVLLWASRRPGTAQHQEAIQRLAHFSWKQSTESSPKEMIPSTSKEI